MDRILKVTGKGKISVKPDTIRLNFRAEGVYPEYAEAVAKSAEETSLIREAVADAGLDPKDLKTVSFGVDTKYESYCDKNNNWKQKFVGYEYQHAMFIRFDSDNALLGRVLASLAKCQVQVEFSMEHTVKDTEAVKNALLRRAVADSKEKAAVLAEAAGVELGRIVNVDYSFDEITITSRPVNRMALAKASGAAEEAAYDINIEADDISVEDTVTVVWEIR